jgi:hypothetical protein
LAGRIPRLRRATALKIVFALALVCVTLALPGSPAARADGNTTCVFPFAPTTYEGTRDRKMFLDTIDLAAFDMLFPGDPYFGLPPIEVGPRDDRWTEPGFVPPVLLKSIAYIESAIAQGDASVPFGSVGPALVAFDCGHGVTQVTNDMTLPDGEAGLGSPQQALVATHFAYNIARGAAVLVDKWNKAPEELPIAGSNTQGHPALLENWYYAVWAYNGFTGPGSGHSNHPMDPIYGEWPRTSYSCGPANDGLGHNRNNYPYQELVFGCAGHPPEVDGVPLWDAQPVSLPDLNSKTVKQALDFKNFVYPYSRMDIPTASPFHMDFTPAPDPSLRDEILGTPELALSTTDTQIDFVPGDTASTQDIDVFNTGSGLLAWYALGSASWLKVTPYTGVAVGLNLPCNPGVPCDRAGHIAITVDPKKAPPGATDLQLVIQGLGLPLNEIVTVHVNQVDSLDQVALSGH